jgi:ketosteroid isomerase-like protein
LQFVHLPGSFAPKGQPGRAQHPLNEEEELMENLTDKFIDALHRLHADREVEPLVALFAADATLSKLGHQHEEHGPEGARTFWEQYRAVFDDIEATFTHTIAGEDSVALEWTSTGSLRGGHPFSYDGISILQGDGEQLHGFRTYYDSAAFVGEARG